MRITTDTNSYKVVWSKSGFSYATPRVYVRKQLWIFPIAYWKFVWEGRHKTYITARNAHKDEIEEWFKAAVHQYEQHAASWKK